ncbi:OmpA family protein [Rhodocytophaga aerolata]|uniref:OmpA family protein n=1 Tax=Rhodocytophaga aerolata TaxID=455078 RepID=A0ABT8RKY1_9BACT|nr:OmpA family protein [Rhodocytophaga aerolata]MDO1451647.1 OmpA family protein [Rhodocytophaga aerolata]
MRVQTIFSILFSLLSIRLAYSQNLISNPSLEQFEGKFAKSWHMIAGSPDIASRHFINADLITRGFFNPFLGPTTFQYVKLIEFGDVCLCQWMNHKRSEVTQVKLSKPLKRKRQYQVSMYVLKASPDEQPLHEMSVYLSSKPLPSAFHPTGYKAAYTSLTSKAYPLLSLDNKWMKVQALYKAKGGERYLTLGNFTGANKEPLAQLLAVEGENFSVYYCYDQLSVIPIEEAEPQEQALEPDEPIAAPLPLQDTLVKFLPPLITLEDANFAFGKYELLENSFSILDELAAYLKEQPQINVQISGHTDNIGKQADNLLLSEKRAKAVMSYLLSKGVSAGRISYKGLGESKPKESNQTEEGRGINRRVEIEMITH